MGPLLLVNTCLFKQILIRKDCTILPLVPHERCVSYASDMDTALAHLLHLCEHVSQKMPQGLEEGVWWKNYLDKDILQSSSPLEHHNQKIPPSQQILLFLLKYLCWTEIERWGEREGRKGERKVEGEGERKRRREGNGQILKRELINHPIISAL